MSDSNIFSFQKDKITVSKAQHDEVYKHFMKANGLASLIKFLIAGFPESDTKGVNTSIAKHPDYGDAIAVCEQLFDSALELAEFLDELHCNLEAQEEKSSSNKDGVDYE